MTAREVCRSRPVPSVVMTTYRAAWVPDDQPSRDNDRAAALAAAWVKSDAATQKATPLLVTSDLSAQRGSQVTSRFAQDYLATTPRGEMRNQRGANRGRGPVLGYLLSYKDIGLATQLARNSSLALVEDRTYPLIGWAMETGALNLRTAEPTPDTRTPHQRKELEHILFNGNNGWADEFAANQTLRILRDLLSNAPLSPEVIVGTMLACGKSSSALANLAKLIERATATKASDQPAPNRSREW
jgi:hypothetical protein